MPQTTRRTVAVARRVGLQLIGDRRFLALSLLVPAVIVYLLKVFVDALESPFFDASAYVFPIAAFIIHFVTYILCAVVLVRERTAQTLQRMFAMGFRRTEVVAGYVAAYSILATIQALVVLIELTQLFKVQQNARTVAAVYAVMCLLAITSIALGILASNFARSEGQIFPFIPLVIIPSVFLSGLIIPVSSLPAWARAASRIIPLYYGAEAVHRFVAPGATGGWTMTAALAAYGAIVLSVAMVTLRDRE